jgi:hypothetical protein
MPLSGTDSEAMATEAMATDSGAMATPGEEAMTTEATY